MKKISKILSSVLAASLVLSCMAMNVMAASKAHVVTITPDKTEGIKAGDTVTIELTVDNTEALCNLGYALTYDATAFTADQTKVSRLEKCIDKAWLDDIKNSDGDWAYYLGNPTYNVKNAGEIKFSWAGAEGVEADYAVDNRVIGKFYLTVNEGVANGEYTFALTGTSMDGGENSKADIVCESVTVKVGEDKPSVSYPFDGSKAFSFTANPETYVSISKTNSEEVNNFWLPKGVKGDASVYGLFKYTADGTDVVAGDVFTIDFVNSDSAAVEVEVAQ